MRSQLLFGFHFFASPTKREMNGSGTAPATEMTGLLSDTFDSSSTRGRRFSFTRRDSVLDNPSVAQEASLERKMSRLLRRAMEWIRVDQWTWQQRILLLSVVVLVLATAGERITYKMAIDRLTPFRTALVLCVLGLSMILYNIIVFAKRVFTNDITEEMTHFSTRPLFLIALLDTAIFSVQTIAASGVSPTMTVILLHANTPMIVWGSRCAFPDRTYGIVQNQGALVIALAILISISRPVLSLIFNENVSYATSTLIYVGASALQGFALLFKEKCLADYGRRMDAYYISAWLFTYQFGLALLLSPLMYLLQDLLSPNPTGFPIMSFMHNMKDGFGCVTGSYNSAKDAEPYTNEYMNCDGNTTLVFGFVVSTALVLLCIDQVLYFKDQILGRAMACSVLFAFATLAVYDYTHPYFGPGLFGSSSVGLADILSIIVLLVGMEIYGRDPEPDIEVITNYVKPGFAAENGVPPDSDQSAGTAPVPAPNGNDPCAPAPVSASSGANSAAVPPV